jgi:hypothetical protein
MLPCSIASRIHWSGTFESISTGSMYHLSDRKEMVRPLFISFDRFLVPSDRFLNPFDHDLNPFEIDLNPFEIDFESDYVLGWADLSPYRAPDLSQCRSENDGTNVTPDRSLSSRRDSTAPSIRTPPLLSRHRFPRRRCSDPVGVDYKLPVSYSQVPDSRFHFLASFQIIRWNDSDVERESVFSTRKRRTPQPVVPESDLLSNTVNPTPQ